MGTDQPSSQTGEKAQCPKCKKTFTQKYNLLRHLKTIHSDYKPYVCDICQRAFNRKGNMEAHRLTHVNSGQI